MSGVAVGADGAVFRNVPGVVAGLPGQWVTERVEHVEQDPGHDGVGVGAGQV